MQDPAMLLSDLGPDRLARRMVMCAHNRDGLPELLAGVGFLAFSGTSWSIVVLHGPAAKAAWVALAMRVAWIALMAVFMTLCLFGGKLVTAIRNRYLIHRVGYVRLRTVVSRKMRLVGLVAAFAISMVLVAVLSKFRMEGNRWWLLGNTGVCICLFEVFVGRMRRFWITGGLAACAAFALAASPIPLEIAMGLLFTFVGMVEIASGGLVLYGLLRSSRESEA